MNPCYKTSRLVAIINSYLSRFNISINSKVSLLYSGYLIKVVNRFSTTSGGMCCISGYSVSINEKSKNDLIAV